MALMKMQFVLTHRYTVLEQTQKKLDRSVIDQHLNTSYFYEDIRRSNFLWIKILTEGVFVTQLASNWKSQFNDLYGLQQTAVS